MKKVLFLIRSREIPSSRVRVIILLDKLKKKGYDVECQIYPKTIKNKFKLFKSLSAYDIVFIQKKMPSFIDLYFFSWLSKKLVFDFDDAIQLKHETSIKKRSRTAEQKFYGILKKADLLVVGNKVLESESRKYNKNIIVVPSVLETDGMPQKDYAVKNENFIVGWVCTVVNLSQLELLGDVFRKLSKVIPLEVRVISGERPNIDGVNLKYIPWTLEGQDKEIAMFDAGVMPLPNDSKHAKGKCGYKAIQYMAAGVVPVLSDVGSNRDIVTDNETGFLIDNIEDFYDRLKYVYDNPETAAKIGRRASEHVKNYYSVDAAVDILDKGFTEL